MSFYSVRRSKREMIDDLPEEHVEADLIGHSTLEYTTPDGRRIIRFHRTNVVTFHPNGDVTLDSGGFQSNTTKKRFNEHAPVDVYQHRHEWFVRTKAGTFPFFDGFTVDRRGRPTLDTYAQLVADDEMPIEELLRTDEYVDRVVNAETVPEVISALAAWSNADAESYRRNVGQVTIGLPRRLSAEDWQDVEAVAADEEHPEYREVAEFAERVQTGLKNLRRPTGVEVLATMAATGRLTRDQLEALPPAIQVAMDAVLERMPP